MSHMYVICGLSSSQVELIRPQLENKHSSFIFCILPIPENNKYSEKFINYTLKQAVERLNPKNLPNTLSIVYKQQANDSTVLNLIDKCFLFANLIPFFLEKEENEIDIQKKLDLIISSNELLTLPAYQLLPARNFMLNKNNTLFEQYKLFSKGEITEDELQKTLESYRVKITKGEIKKLHKKRAYYFVDTRSLVFPKDQEYHGHLSDIDNSLSYLETFYRFGRLQQAGLHYDVQQKGSNLASCEFFCSKKGEVTATGKTHANIYLNDYIRLP